MISRGRGPTEELARHERISGTFPPRGDYRLVALVHRFCRMEGHYGVLGAFDSCFNFSMQRVWPRSVFKIGRRKMFMYGRWVKEHGGGQSQIEEQLPGKSSQT